MALNIMLLSSIPLHYHSIKTLRIKTVIKMPLSKMPHSINTLSIITHSITTVIKMPLNKVTYSIKTLNILHLA